MLKLPHSARVQPQRTTSQGRKRKVALSPCPPWASPATEKGEIATNGRRSNPLPSLFPSPQREFAKAQAHRCPLPPSPFKESARKSAEGGGEYAKRRERSPKGVEGGSFPCEFALLPSIRAGTTTAFPVLSPSACALLSLSPLQRRRGARCLALSLLRSPSPTTRPPCCQLHSPLAPPLDESQPGYERSQGALLFSSLI